MTNNRWLVPVAFLLVYVIWGSTYLAIAKAIETIPPLVMAGVRFVVAGAALYAGARLLGAPKPAPGEWRPAIVVGFFLLLGGNGGVVLAQKSVPTGLTALIVAATAIWMALFQALRPGGHWPRWQAGIGLLGGLAGVGVLLGHKGEGRVDPFGATCLVTASISWALGSIYAKSARLPKSPFVATAVEMMAGGVALMAAAGVAGQWGELNLATVSANSLIAMAYLAVFGSIVAFTAYVWLLSVRPPSLVATYAYVNPVVAVFLGWFFLAEPVTTRMFVAAVAILASVALITTYSNSKSNRPLAAVEVLDEQRA